MAKQTLAGLKPNPKNPRKITDAKARMLRDSLARFGDISGLVFNRTSGQLVGGHQRVEAFKGLGASDVTLTKQYDVPSHAGTVAEGHVDISGERYAYREVEWDEATEKAANLAANKGAGEWDLAQVAEWVDELAEVSFDLDLTMFDADEREGLMPDSQLIEEKFAEEDDLADPPTTVAEKVSAGDVWALGSHRIACGDCGDVNLVSRLMGGRLADAVVTDPPYGISQPGVPNDEPEKLAGLLEGMIRTLPVAGAAIAVFQSTRTFTTYLDVAREAGHVFERMLWMYKRGGGAFPWHGWIMVSEAILIFTTGNASFNEVKPYSHDCYLVDQVWDKELAEVGGWHGSAKPLAVVADVVTRVSPPQSLVYDGFLGSGTTLIACEKTERVCYGVEYTPSYCDVIIARWEKVTGKQAKLVSSGGAEAPDGR
jgi:hypothetical protein